MLVHPKWGENIVTLCFHITETTSDSATSAHIGICFKVILFNLFLLFCKHFLHNNWLFPLNIYHKFYLHKKAISIKKSIYNYKRMNFGTKSIKHEKGLGDYKMLKWHI